MSKVHQYEVEHKVRPRYIFFNKSLVFFTLLCLYAAAWSYLILPFIALHPPKSVIWNIYLERQGF